MTKGSSVSAFALSTADPGTWTGRRREFPASPSIRASVPLRLKRSHARGQRRGKPHGGDDLDMRAAAAEIEAQRLADLGLGRFRIAVEQGAGGHDHAVQAIAALRGG